MLTHSGQLTYCTNIHHGENWKDHFNEIKKYFPGIKKELSPDRPMGIGLRLSNIASIELVEGENMALFTQWLRENDAYVFTMNGFPYGSFHDTRVKDQVHAPDWTTHDRVAYTTRLFHILKELLPAGMEGGISTSPLSYKYWFKQEDALKNAMKTSTANIVLVVEELIKIHRATGKILHLDIEPEPDGMLESGVEFMHWFLTELLADGTKTIAAEFNVSIPEAERLLKEHLRLCYDVCHFAIGYEPHAEIIQKLLQSGIKIGKIQISAALKGRMDKDIRLRQNVKESFSVYNEPTYLHQVVARKNNGDLLRYPDLAEALSDYDNPDVNEWRAHFHVPIFEEDFGLLQSTQKDIKEVLQLQKALHFTSHLEVETYTWEVLPGSLKLPLHESVIRELQWVVPQL
ncbi:metabolite traffic protein EboE [Flavihumibacter profundi]|uniref:metabolite traffic protein EboE n=1 Tax=Flavihumibacter profundi TaxID=2716883 RepID=UPI001CC7BF8A|nr:metabolite traffic protein EboE [Flavihumibacter profundi]MBZ5856391.1 metabolite traffic protein EboE [Flavihumibacter profundi]